MLRGHFGLATLTCVGLAIASLITPAKAWNRGAVQIFALLPPGDPMVEGLTVGKDGKVYSPTFNPTGSAPSLIFTFDPQGHILNRKPIQNSSNAMLGLHFYPGTDALLVIDFDGHQVLSVNPETGDASPCVTLPSNMRANSGLNGITFDAAGNIYVSDSFQGIIWRRSVTAGSTFCGEATAWFTVDGGPDPNLLPFSDEPPHGVPPFGANGIEFNNEGTAMFAANTAMDWIVKIPVLPNGAAGPSSVFTNSINGADGIAIDKNDNIWAAANQSDEMVVIDPTGKAIAKLGDFNGVQGGTTDGLLFPASPAFSPDGQWLYVTNLELDLTTIGITQSVDSQWAAQVTRHSIAKLGARIPPIH